MIGKQIGESKGKRLVRRVLSTEPPTVEVTFEDSGHMSGIPTTGIGTYTSVIAADLSIEGHGQGILTTEDGDGIAWKGTGLGKFGQAGAVSYRGMLFYKTTSQKLAHLNNSCGAFEFEVDSSGATVSKVWEWK
jgi:hypothetical protein